MKTPRRQKTNETSTGGIGDIGSGGWKKFSDLISAPLSGRMGGGRKTGRVSREPMPDYASVYANKPDPKKTVAKKPSAKPPVKLAAKKGMGGHRGS